jgi:phospholipid/cholesterol/gamma-HCH transport system substrate-binding protein
MYASRTTQLIVGIFTIAGILALAFLSMRLGRVDLFSTPRYTLYANFNNISGLKTGDQVQIAGVTVGKVTAISLRQDRAHVAMGLQKGIDVDSDAIASVFTSGLIGDKYVAIALGGGDTLPNGGTIRQTQDAFQLETAIGKLIDNFGGGGGSSTKSGVSSDNDSSDSSAKGAAATGNPPGVQSNTTPATGNAGKEKK